MFTEKAWDVDPFNKPARWVCLALSPLLWGVLLVGGAASPCLRGAALGSPQSSTSTNDEIDGAKTPYLIPDAIAYRLVMLSLTLPASPSKVDVFKQEARLQRMNLSESDRATVKAVMGQFGKDYETWIANAETSTLTRDDITQRYLALLERQLTAEGLNAFRAYVMAEKVKMRMPKQG
jgi:hypothetical protein